MKYMDLEALREAQSRERQAKGLRELSDSFYRDAARYIQGLREERDGVDDPYGEEAQQLNDALQSARQVAESIYERRVSKVVKLAALSANGVDVEEAGMTREERRMYDNIVEEIQRNHELVVGEVLGTENGSADDETPADSEPVTESDPGSEAGDEDDDYTTVRVTESLPEFVGVDGREYSLEEEDVAVIPEENAQVLVEKDAAVEIDP